MIENYLGEADFRKGLNIYLNRFKYGNAVTKGSLPLYSFLHSSLTTHLPVNLTLSNYYPKELS